MKLRHLAINRFRGIGLLDWSLRGDFLCMVGPGDSGKSSILDAIELLFSPRWNPNFYDSDFFNGNHSEPIVIEGTVGALPQKFISDARFGLRLRGYRSDDLDHGPIHDEPIEGDEEVITIRLTVDSSLEPTWKLVTDRHPEGVPISAREREKFGVIRLGTFIDRHLFWSRGSVLSRITGKIDEHAKMIAEANRIARDRVSATSLPHMAIAAEEVAKLARRFGVRPHHQFGPRMDASHGIAASALALHDGAIPVRRAGLGTRRLITIAMQRGISDDGGILLVDEVEHGLEPYRIRRLLAELIRPTHDKNVNRNDKYGQTTILTSHSPVVLGELRTSHLRIVHQAKDGHIEILKY